MTDSFCTRIAGAHCQDSPAKGIRGWKYELTSREGLPRWAAGVVRTPGRILRLRGRHCQAHIKRTKGCNAELIEKGILRFSEAESQWTPPTRRLAPTGLINDYPRMHLLDLKCEQLGILLYKLLMLPANLY